MKKLGLLILAMILALGVMGVGYARWMDTVTVQGSVSTGKVCLSALCDPNTYKAADGPVSYLDINPITGKPLGNQYDYANLIGGYDIGGTTYTCDPDFYKTGHYAQLNKNVGWTTIDCPTTPDPESFTINFHNVYPGYWNHYSFGLTNCGSVPVKLDHVVITNVNNPSQKYYLLRNNFMCFDLSGNGTSDFEVFWGDNFGVQTEPGDSYNISFWIQFLEDESIDFSVSHDYSLTFEIVVVQWNEYPIPVPASPPPTVLR